MHPMLHPCHQLCPILPEERVLQAWGQSSHNSRMIEWNQHNVPSQRCTENVLGHWSSNWAMIQFLVGHVTAQLRRCKAYWGMTSGSCARATRKPEDSLGCDAADKVGHDSKKIEKHYSKANVFVHLRQWGIPRQEDGHPKMLLRILCNMQVSLSRQTSVERFPWKVRHRLSQGNMGRPQFTWDVAPLTLRNLSYLLSLAVILLTCLSFKQAVCWRCPSIVINQVPACIKDFGMHQTEKQYSLYSLRVSIW